MSVRIQPRPITASSITYTQYVRAIDILASGRSFEEAGIFGDFFKKVFSPLKKVFEKVGEHVKMGMDEFAEAFKAKNVYALMKAIRFNVMLLFKAVNEAGKWVDKGLIGLIHKATSSELFQKVRKGAATVDDFLDAHPMLKKVSGVVVAGLLFWIWLNMSFTGNAASDFDLSTVGLALTGRFSIEDLFTTDEGVYMIALLAPGLLGVSFPWLGHQVANLIVAIAYTGYKFLRNNGRLKELKSRIPLKRLK